MEAFWNSWERFFNELSTFLDSVQRHEIRPNKSYCEYVVQRLELWIVSVSQLTSHIESAQDQEGLDVDNSPTGAVVHCMLDLVKNLRLILHKWSDYLEHFDVITNQFSYRSPHVEYTTVGRPRYTVSKEQLEYLRSMSFSWVHISEILGVSYMTVYRRRMEYGIVESRGRDVSDSQLEQIITEMRYEQPAVGQTMLWAHVRSLGYQITRARIRDAIRRTDPISSAFRWTDMTPRRPYSVPSPNSLWHLGKL